MPVAQLLMLCYFARSTPYNSLYVITIALRRKHHHQRHKQHQSYLHTVTRSLRARACGLTK